MWNKIVGGAKKKKSMNIWGEIEDFVKDTLTISIGIICNLLLFVFGTLVLCTPAFLYIRDYGWWWLFLYIPITAMICATFKRLDLVGKSR